MRVTLAAARAARKSGRAPGAIALALVASLLWSRQAQPQPLACPTDARQISDAVDRIRRAVDPCGESTQVLEVLERLERCPGTGYRICASTELDRNVFDRPRSVSGELPRGSITWNPELRTVLEEARDGDPTTAVRRDPTASLLHELVHAVQECAGLNPGEHELEAVRVENIYRRAAGLVQRSGYGDTLLPPEMVRMCRVGDCPCSTPFQARSLAGTDDGRAVFAAGLGGAGASAQR